METALLELVALPTLQEMYFQKYPVCPLQLFMTLMSQPQKIGLLVCLIVVALGIAVFGMLHSSGGDAQASVAEFAKSIDHTKGDSPSVPADRLALGHSGPTKGSR